MQKHITPIACQEIAEKFGFFSIDFFDTLNNANSEVEEIKIQMPFQDFIDA